MPDRWLQSADGTVWVGNHDALDEIHDGAVSSIRTEQGLPGKRVTVMLEDHLGRLWVGADNTLSVREGGRFHGLIRSDGSPVGTLQALIEDRNGDLWGMPAPTTSRLIHVHGFTVQEEPIGPATSRIISIVADPDGGIRVGFRSGDIATYRNGTLSMAASKANGLIFQLQHTSDGHLVGLSSGKLTGWQNGRTAKSGVAKWSPLRQRIYLRCGQTRNALAVFFMRPDRSRQSRIATMVERPEGHAGVQSL